MGVAVFQPAGDWAVGGDPRIQCSFYAAQNLLLPDLLEEVNGHVAHGSEHGEARYGAEHEPCSEELHAAVDELSVSFEVESRIHL
jgi:hypothetical protein